MDETEMVNQQENTMKRKQRATLNKTENICWENAFAYWIDAGKTELQADWYAWRNICRLFPRLKKYTGARR